jgi:hypothetical protein
MTENPYHLKLAELVGTQPEQKQIVVPRGSGIINLFSRAFGYL